jgi:hypothetical protein
LKGLVLVAVQEGQHCLLVGPASCEQHSLIVLNTLMNAIQSSLSVPFPPVQNSSQATPYQHCDLQDANAEISN